MLSRAFLTLYRLLMRWLPASGQKVLRELSQMPLGRRLVRGAAASLIMTAVSVLLGIANSVLLGRALGPEGFGLYSLAMVWSGLLTAPFWAGLITLLTRETGRVMATGTRADMRALLRWSYWLAGIFSLAITLAAAAVLYLLSDRLGSARYAIGAVSLILLGLVTIMPLNSTVLRGLGGLVRSQFCDLVLRPSLTLASLLALALVFGWHSLSAIGGVTAQIIAVGGTICVSTWWLVQGLRDLPLDAHPEQPIFTAGPRWRSLLAFCAMAGVGSLSGSIDTLILGGFESTSTVGVYRVAMIGVQLIVSFIGAIHTIVLPSIARLHAQGDRERLQRLLTLTARSTVLLAATPVVILIVFGQPLLRFAFGEAFAAGAPAMAIAAAGQLLAAMAGPVSSVLNMTGHETAALRYSLIGVAASAAGCFLLIPWFGITGAAIANNAAMLLLVGLSSWNAPRLTGVSSTVFGRR